MTTFRAALWSESLKTRRSRVPRFAALGFAIAPLGAGLFMFILKDPQRARSMGLISAKAQLMAGVADWPTFLRLLVQITAVGGMLVFAFLTAWVFGREFSDRTVKEILVVQTSREAIVTAKFVVVALWATVITVLALGLGFALGAAIGMPGWSTAVARNGITDLVTTAILALALMPPVAFFASVGRGYLGAFGWTLLTLVLAQVASGLGWGSWFPWAVPALVSPFAGSRGAPLGPQSYVVVALTCVVGLAATFAWWRGADQAR
jgi:ABC-2 type transport system permease protein